MMTKALEDVAAERFRQVEVEGWTADHDDTHGAAQMGYAAAAYVLSAAGHYGPDRARWVPGFWPWDRHWWKPRSPREDLVRAAALIVAEIERLDRAAKRAAGDPA